MIIFALTSMGGIISLIYDTVALEEGSGLKGKPPPDDTSSGTKRHQLSLSISIDQYSG